MGDAELVDEDGVELMPSTRRSSATRATRERRRGGQLAPPRPRVPTAAIRTDGGTQSRAAIDPETVQEYAVAYADGRPMPPIVVYYDGADYWLADGFHRVRAVLSLSLSTIEAEVRQGTQRDAVLASCGVNATHGLRRSAADKRRAVEVLLRDPEWRRWSDREIARRCVVHHELVGRMRSEVTGGSASERTYTTRHGTTATMDTGAIGRRAEDQHPDDFPSVFPPRPVVAGGVDATTSVTSVELAGDDRSSHPYVAFRRWGPEVDLQATDLGLCACEHRHGFTRCPNTGGVAVRCDRLGCECFDFVPIREGQIAAARRALAELQPSTAELREVLVDQTPRDVRAAVRTERRKNDAYYTPDPVAAACVKVLGPIRQQFFSMLEPHVGGGAWARQFPDRDVCVMDIDPEAAGLRLGESVVGDFLSYDFGGERFDLIVGNPPYDEAEAHVRKALSILAPTGRLAFLLRRNFGAPARFSLLEEFPPLREYILGPRVSFTGDGGSDSQEYSFFVWMPSHIVGSHWMTSTLRWKS